MRTRWIGILVVLLAAVGVIAIKQWPGAGEPRSVAVERPSVLLVADLHEADDPRNRCACAEIIRAVREANKRGVRVRELMPNGDPDLIRRYRVLTAPTVLILADSGKELGRFEGESSATLEAVRARLLNLSGSNK